MSSNESNASHKGDKATSTGSLPAQAVCVAAGVTQPAVVADLAGPEIVGMKRDSLAEAARKYAGYGWKVVAVKGKAPIGAGWQNRATSDPGEAMAAMLDERVDLDGLGIVLHPSGLVDLDADCPEAEEAIQKVFGGNVPITPTYQSARGLHRLFAARDWPEDVADKNKWMAGPIEVRGCGPKAAQSVFPPSGGRHWIHSPEIVAPAELSDEVAAALVELHRASPSPPRFLKTRESTLTNCPRAVTQACRKDTLH